MLEVIFYFVLMIGSHEMGHQVEADNLNSEIKWQGPNWYYSGGNKKDLELITNSAFDKQDAVGHALKSPTYWKLNGAYKLSYVYRDELDMKNITDETKFFLGVSGLLNSVGLDYRFAQLNENTTGLIKTWRF